VINKRKSERKATLAKCMVKRLFLREKLFSSRIINYSENGLMIETDVKFRAGDAVTIYFSSEAQKETHFNTNCCVGMVRWCAEQIGCLGGYYGVGVELAQQSMMPV
jgi:Tfp pilus assembly protein PilZ